MSRLLDAAENLLYRTRAYWAWLKRRGAPKDLAVAPADPWPGDPELGAAIIRGDAPFCGQNLPIGAGVWRPEGARPAWMAEAHGFAWLRDLHAAGGDAARARARELVRLWIEHHSQWDPLIHRADVLGARVAAWLGHYEFLIDSGGDALRAPLLGAAAMQLAHLGRVAETAPKDRRRFTALKGLVYGLWCLPYKQVERRRVATIKLLEQSLTAQIRLDGGHIERSPSGHLAVLRDLIEMRAVMRAARATPPEALTQAIERMVPALKLLRHGDGSLALFNDSNEEESWLIDHVLSASECAAPAAVSLPQTGFQRAANGKMVLIAECGAPALLGSATHAGALSIELSVGKDRIFVNCGAHPPDGSEWRRAQRATAAHSTLCVDDADSIDWGGEGRPPRGPRSVTNRRDETDHAVWLDLSHDGYAAGFGVVHRRRIYIAPSGEDVRGEDSLLGDGRGHFCVHFHLHPRIQPSVTADGAAVSLRLPSGAVWRFRASGGDLRVGESIYLGRRGETRRSAQILVSGELGGDQTVVKWALQRDDGRRAAAAPPAAALGP